MSDKKQRFFNERFVGSVRPALIEMMSDKDIMYGFTDNYIKVELPYDETLKNTIVNVKLETVLENGNVKGSVVE